MTITKSFPICDVKKGRSILVEFVKDTNDRWFWIYRDNPTESDYSGGSGGNKYKSLKKTVGEFAKTAEYMEKGYLKLWRKQNG